jgi:type I restriction enzyme S subunit
MALTKSIPEIISEDTSGLLGIHHTWTRVRLGDVTSIINGFPFESAFFSTDRGVPLIRIRDVSEGRTRTFYQGEFDEQFLVERGDLLVGMDGDFNTARWRSEPALLNQRVCKLTPEEHWYHPSLLEFALPGYLSAINAATSSITVKHLSSRSIEDIELPLPPRQEQDRIVQKLEELVSDLDAGVAELKAAQRKLAQYRQSLLKAAVEGAITADWRAARASFGESQETGANLLQRILTERRARWEAKQLAKYAEQGKAPTKGWQAKYPDVASADKSNLAILPTSWTWSSLGECFFVAVGATPSRKEPRYWGGRIAWVSSGEVRFERITQTRETITAEGLNNTSTQINPKGSVLLGMIGEGKTRGQVAILDIDAANNQNCAAIWVPETEIASEYVYYWLWSRYDETRRGSSGNNQPALNKSIVETIPFPLPPLEEIRQIVELVESALAQVARQEAAIEHALKQVAAQRKNILKAAFAGQLVPQNPNDEAASVLLERIRTERTYQAVSAKPRGRKPRTTA